MNTRDLSNFNGSAILWATLLNDISSNFGANVILILCIAWITMLSLKKEEEKEN